MSRHEKLRLLDILDAIDRITSYVEGMGYDDFLADRRVVTRPTNEQHRRLPGQPGGCGEGWRLSAGGWEQPRAKPQRPPRRTQSQSKPR